MRRRSSLKKRGTKRLQREIPIQEKGLSGRNLFKPTLLKNLKAIELVLGFYVNNSCLLNWERPQKSRIDHLQTNGSGGGT
jgi:hypothetical protein